MMSPGFQVGVFSGGPWGGSGLFFLFVFFLFDVFVEFFE